MENNRLVDVKPRISDDVDKIKSWKISDIADPSQMKALRLPDSTTSGKVWSNLDKFIYINPLSTS